MIGFEWYFEQWGKVTLTSTIFQGSAQEYQGEDA